MPFPLAHPAAVLPLRRYCPTKLSFSALIIGSIVPDLAYVFAPLKLDALSHRFWGSFGFNLPAGLAIFWAFTHLRNKELRILPVRLREAILTSISKEHAGIYSASLSILIGAWTHILWDSFTHKNGWIVLHLPVLQLPISSMFGHTVRVFHLLWYLSSFAGVAVFWLAYEGWKRRQNLGPCCTITAETPAAKAVLLGCLTLALGAVHHLVHSWVIFSFACMAAGALFLVFEWRNWEPAER